MRKPFIAIEVGCIECHESTLYRGQFATRQEAQAAFDKDNDRQHRERSGMYASRRQAIFDLREPIPFGEYPE